MHPEILLAAAAAIEVYKAAGHDLTITACTEGGTGPDLCTICTIMQYDLIGSIRFGASSVTLNVLE